MRANIATTHHTTQLPGGVRGMPLSDFLPAGSGGGGRGPRFNPFRESYIKLAEDLDDRVGIDLMAHLTFRYPKCNEEVDAIFRAWTNALHRRVFGNGYWRRDEKLEGFRVAERGDRNGTRHFHVLLSGVPAQKSGPALTRFARDKWHKLAGWAQVEEFNSRLGGIRYTFKNVTLGAEVELI